MKRKPLPNLSRLGWLLASLLLVGQLVYAQRVEWLNMQSSVNNDYQKGWVFQFIPEFFTI